MTPVWEQPVEQVDDTGQRAEDLNEPVYGQSDGLGGAVGPIQQVETQVLVDGEPVTVTDAARQQPGRDHDRGGRPRPAAAAGGCQGDPRRVWERVHHEEPDQQITAR